MRRSGNAPGKVRVSKKLVRSFFQALFEGRLSESQKILSQIGEKAGKDEASQKYLQALSGMHYVYATDDKDSLLMTTLRAESRRKRRLALMKEIKGFSSWPTVGESDEGFYRAWIDLLRMLPRLPQPHRVRQEKRAIERPT